MGLAASSTRPWIERPDPRIRRAVDSGRGAGPVAPVAVAALSRLSARPTAASAPIVAYRRRGSSSGPWRRRRGGYARPTRCGSDDFAGGRSRCSPRSRRQGEGCLSRPVGRHAPPGRAGLRAAWWGGTSRRPVGRITSRRPVGRDLSPPRGADLSPPGRAGLPRRPVGRDFSPPGRADTSGDACRRARAVQRRGASRLIQPPLLPLEHSAPIGPSGRLACRSTVGASSRRPHQAGLERADQREGRAVARPGR